MAVHTERKPMEKKHYKKLVKVMHSVEKDFGARLSPVPTKFIVLSNAGLANGATTAAILKVLPENRQTDTEDMNYNVILWPDKHYCFLQCSSVEAAEKAVECISGKPCMEFLGDQPVYAGYLDRDVPAPEVHSGPLPPGLTILENRIKIQDESKWLEVLSLTSEDISTSDSSTASLKHREVEHFGYNFDYSINGVHRNQPLHEKPLPLICTEFLENLQHEGLFQPEQFPNQLTINRYPPGAGIPAHCDTHSMFECCIVIVSLGSDVVMEFRRLGEGPACPVRIRRGSVVFMQNESRYGWTHSIIPRRYDLVAGSAVNCAPEAVARGTRVSFTFRRIRPEDNPCDCAFSSLCDSQLSQNPPQELALGDQEARKLEEMHVHEVYDDIAKHFSGTRYAQWPRVGEFLRSLPEGAVVADIGCGNGKNMKVEGRPDLYFIGGDRSLGLLDICRQRNLEICQIDCLQVPFRDGVFDAAICIAVLHHLANIDRRREGLRQLVQLVRAGGKVLVYVWAKEQKYTGSESKYLKEPSKQSVEGQGRDKVVGEDPIRSSGDSIDQEVKSTSISDSVCNEGNTCTSASNQPIKGRPSKKKIDSMNAVTQPGICNVALVEVGTKKLTIPVHRNRSDFTAGTDLLVPWSKVQEGQVKHRFYHVFQQGELKSLVNLVAEECPLRIETEYYDEGNWCAVLVKE